MSRHCDPHRSKKLYYFVPQRGYKARRARRHLRLQQGSQNPAWCCPVGDHQDAATEYDSLASQILAIRREARGHRLPPLVISGVNVDHLMRDPPRSGRTCGRVGMTRQLAAAGPAITPEGEFPFTGANDIAGASSTAYVAA